jgi:hypothetical protein
MSIEGSSIAIGIDAAVGGQPSRRGQAPTSRRQGRGPRPVCCCTNLGRNGRVDQTIGPVAEFDGCGRHARRPLDNPNRPGAHWHRQRTSWVGESRPVCSLPLFVDQVLARDPRPRRARAHFTISPRRIACPRSGAGDSVADALRGPELRQARILI